MAVSSVENLDRLIASQNGVALLDSGTLFRAREVKAPFIKGETRDIYDLGQNLLVVTTDRFIVDGVLMTEGVAGKGIVASQMTEHWFERMDEVLPSHLLTSDIDLLPEPFKGRDGLRGRTMLVRKVSIPDVGMTVKGYLAGKSWKEYLAAGKVSGVELPRGLQEAERLEEPIFVATTRNGSGYDKEISFSEMTRKVEDQIPNIAQLSTHLRTVSLGIYEIAHQEALRKGVVLAEARLKFGMDNWMLNLVGEPFIPDTAILWRVSDYQSDEPNSAIRPVVAYLDSIGWDRRAPAPFLPEEIVADVQKGYRRAYLDLVG